MTNKKNNISTKIKLELTRLSLCASILAIGCEYIDPADYASMSPEEAIASVSTPREAARYNGTLTYPENDIPRKTFTEIHTSRVAECENKSTAAAALLKDNGYPAWVLDMFNDNTGHEIFVYTENNLWGYIDGNINISPKYNNINELFGGYNAEGKYSRYKFFKIPDRYLE